MRHDRVSSLTLFFGDLMETRNICIGLLLLSAPDEVAIRAEPRGQFPSVRGIRSIRHRVSEGWCCQQ